MLLPLSLLLLVAEPALRPPPGAHFTAVAGGPEALYVLDSNGAVHVSTDGKTFRTAHPPMGPGSPDDAADADDDADDASDEGAADGAGAGEGEGADDDAGTDPGDPFSLQEGFGWVGNNTWLDLTENGPMFFRSSGGDLFAFPYGTTGEEYLEFTPDSPAFWDPPWLNGLTRPDSWSLDPTLSARLHMERARAFFVPAPAAATALAVDEDDARVAFVAGPGGLARTDDAGFTWTAIDDGNCTAVAAASGRAVALCDGAVVVVDGATTFRGADVEGARFVALSPSALVVGAGHVLVSHDEGATFVDTGVAGSCAAAAGSVIAVGSDEGLAVSRDGGATFQRNVAGVDGAVTSVVAAGTKLLAVGDGGIFASDDAGATFHAREGDADDGDVVGATFRAVVRADAVAVDGPAPESKPADEGAALDALRAERASEPTADDVIRGAHAKLAPLDEGDAPSFVPRVDVVGGLIATDSTAVLDAVFLDRTAAGDAEFVRQTAEQATQNGKPAAFNRHVPYLNGYVAVLLSWDLPSFFAPSSSPARLGAARVTRSMAPPPTCSRRARSPPPISRSPAATPTTTTRGASSTWRSSTRSSSCCRVCASRRRRSGRRTRSGSPTARSRTSASPTRACTTRG